MNDKIVAAAVKAANGGIPGLPKAGGYCLQFVRMVIENAMGWPSHRFYEKYLVAATSARGGDGLYALDAARADPWAADMEASVKALKWAVPFAERQAGDLIFNHKAARPVGHVGILLTEDMVIENIKPSYRPKSIHIGVISLTPLRYFPYTLVARVRADE